MNNYFCPKCRLIVKKNSMPNATTCSYKNKHDWKDMGPVGENIYQCASCWIDVYSKNTPSTAGCPVKTTHSWNEL